MYSYLKRPPRRKFMNDEPTMTIQSAADDCDINKMIARYQRTGSYHNRVSVPSGRPEFGDFSDVKSYHEAQNIIIAAEESFASLPASVRDRFRNDPGQLLEFLENSSNLDEAVKLGLCVARPVEPVVEAAKE